MKIVLEFNRSKAVISSLGAEIKELCLCGCPNIIWSGSPQTWSRSAPTVFPVLGGLSEDLYTVDERIFRMQKNGFARTAEFFADQHSPNTVQLMLKSTPETLKVYPFHFCFEVWYTLTNELEIRYRILNTGSEPMPFVVGGHPGFRWNRREGWKLRFLHSKHLTMYRPDGQEAFCLHNASELELFESLFSEGALCCRNFESPWVAIVPPEGKRCIQMTLHQMNAITLWTMTDDKARFLCVEPSTGVGAYGGDLRQRYGIHELMPGETMSAGFDIRMISVDDLPKITETR